MIECGLLRVPQIVQNGAGGGNGQRTASQTATLQRQQAEMIAQRGFAIIETEHPILQRGAEARKPVEFFRRQHFADVEILQDSGDVGCVHFGGTEFAGGNIDMSHTRPCSLRRYGSQIVVLMRTKQYSFRRRARRDHAGNFAAHQLFRRAGCFHLIADGHAVTLLDKPRDVAIGRMIRHAAHGNCLAFFLVAGSQRDFQLARRSHRIVVEKLVEIAQTE